MVLLNAQNLNKYYGERCLFENLCLEIHDGDRIGFVGANGMGKTTLFRILTGDSSYDSGSISVSKKAKIGCMQQHVSESSSKTAFDEVLSVFDNIIKIESELYHINSHIDSAFGAELSALIESQHLLTEQFTSMGGLTYKSRSRAALLGLGFTDAEITLPLSKLSGGQRSKVSLAKLLISDANLLLLDEPTNHLDIKSVRWLEDFLSAYSGAVVIISHDRYFLDRVTNKTAELENRKLTVVNGNYSEWTQRKAVEHEIAVHHYETAIKEIKRIEEVIKQKRQFNREKSVRQAESKEKMLNRMKAALEKPDAVTEGFSFDFKLRKTSGNDVLLCENLEKRYGSKLLFKNAGLDIKRGEKVFLIGDNGCGKTTLFKMLMCGGDKIKLGTNVEIGYYDQTLQGLDDSKDVISEVWDCYPGMTETAVRSSLAAFLFYGDDVYKSVAELSGGERARISLLKLMLSGANTLFLDEPTNHLDIYAMEALEDALTVFEGTLLIISHDRYFINKLADRIYLLTENGTRCFLGNYDYYAERTAKEAEPEQVTPKPVKPTVNDYKLRKEKASAMKKQKTRLRRLEEEINSTEQELENIEAEISLPCNADDYVKIMELTTKQAELGEKLTTLMDEWEKLAEAVEE